MKAVRIGNLAGHIKRHDCASAVWQYLVAAKKAFREKAALGGSVALPDNVFIRRKCFHLDWQVEEALPLVSRKGGDAFQLSNELIERLIWHFALHRLGREHNPLSATSARKTVLAGDGEQRIIERKVPLATLSCTALNYGTPASNGVIAPLAVGILEAGHAQRP